MIDASNVCSTTANQPNPLQRANWRPQRRQQQINRKSLGVIANNVSRQNQPPGHHNNSTTYIYNRTTITMKASNKNTKNKKATLIKNNKNNKKHIAQQQNHCTAQVNDTNKQQLAPTYHQHGVINWD